MAEVLGELLVQRRLQHRLGELLQHAARTGQRKSLLLGLADQLTSCCSSADSSGGSFFFATVSSVAVITAPFPPASQRTCQAEHTVRSTGPLAWPARERDEAWPPAVR